VGGLVLLWLSANVSNDGVSPDSLNRQEPWYEPDRIRIAASHVVIALGVDYHSAHDVSWVSLRHHVRVNSAERMVSSLD
jgi:hypothetical protein